MSTQYGDVPERIAKLETRMDYVHESLEELKRDMVDGRTARASMSSDIGTIKVDLVSIKVKNEYQTQTLDRIEKKLDDFPPSQPPHELFGHHSSRSNSNRNSDRMDTIKKGGIGAGIGTAVIAAVYEIVRRLG